MKVAGDKSGCQFPHPPPRVREKIKEPTSNVAMDRSPYAQQTLVTGFPVGIVSFKSEACLDGEIQTSLVLKVDADVVVAGSSGEHHVFDGLAFGLGIVNELSESVRSRDAV